MALTDLLVERKRTHGDFSTGAEFCQGLKEALRDAPSWSLMSSPQREALDMIAHKITRIVYGDPNHRDSWEDIIGYATRAVETMEKTGE